MYDKSKVNVLAVKAILASYKLHQTIVSADHSMEVDESKAQEKFDAWFKSLQESYPDSFAWFKSVNIGEDGGIRSDEEVIKMAHLLVAYCNNILNNKTSK